MLSLPKNVWILAITFSFAMTGITMLIFIGGLIGSNLAPSPNLATLPIAAFVIGNAILTIPAALLNKKLGRKGAGYSGLLLTFASSIAAICAINVESFSLFIFATVLTGSGSAFFQQFRFAAIESLDNLELTGPALSLLMLFTLIGAIFGPELGALGHQLIPSFANYTGSYLAFGLVIVIAACVFSQFQNPKTAQTEEHSGSRSISEIVLQPAFIVAVLAAGVGYTVMSFLMTSTPLSMHQHHGFSLAESKWVIQSHMVAMFLPSLFSGYLVKKIGPSNLMIIGSLFYIVVVVIALSGQHLMHYWWALVVLGVGWNFLFLSGTTLLPSAYKHSERFKAQAINDFSVFGLQAIASLSAAWVLMSFGWNTQVLICLPLTLIVLIAAIYYRTSKANAASQ